MDFINTLPCQVNYIYTGDNVTISLSLNKTSYHVEYDLKIESLVVEAITSVHCGSINVTIPKCKGIITGSCSKVIFH